MDAENVPWYSRMPDTGRLIQCQKKSMKKKKHIAITENITCGFGLTYAVVFLYIKSFGWKKMHWTL